MRSILSNFYGFVKVLGNWLKSNILMILLCFFMFGLGILEGSKILKRPPIMITGDVVDMSSFKSNVLITTTTTVKSGFVASKRGRYYYPAGCKLADSLSPANLIHFDIESKAIEAGYIRQTKCD